MLNQGAWEGMKKYAEEMVGISYKYYQPQEGTTTLYLETIVWQLKAVQNWSRPWDSVFEEPVYLVLASSTRTYISFF